MNTTVMSLKEVNLVLFSQHVISYQIICHIMSHHIDEEEASIECWGRYMDGFQETSALWMLCKILCLSEYLHCFSSRKIPIVFSNFSKGFEMQNG